MTTSTLAPPHVSGWMAVTLSGPVDGGQEAAVLDLDGARVGWIRCQGRVWTAARDGYGPAVTALTRDQALTALDWLQATTVFSLAHTFPRGAEVVFADGTVLGVEYVEPTAGQPGTYTLLGQMLPQVLEPLEMARRRPAEWTAMAASIRGTRDDNRSTLGPSLWRIVVAADQLIALAPPCPDCGTRSGEPCHPYPEHC